MTSFRQSENIIAL